MRAPLENRPTLRAFLIIFAIAILVVALRLTAPLVVLSMLLSVALFVALVWWLYALLREHREEISLWPGRAQFAFYGGIFLIGANLGVWMASGLLGGIGFSINGPVGVAWLLVFPFCGYAIWRVWRDQHTYV